MNLTINEGIYLKYIYEFTQAILKKITKRKKTHNFHVLCGSYEFSLFIFKFIIFPYVRLFTCFFSNQMKPIY